MKVFNMISKFDNFGASLDLIISEGNSKHRTPIGAIATFLIYSTALSYFIYLIYGWQNNQVLPKQTTQTVFNVESTYKFDSSPFYFNVQPLDYAFFSVRGQKIYDVELHFFQNGSPQQIYKDYKPKCKQAAKNIEQDLLQPICLDLNDTKQQQISQRSYTYDFNLDEQEVKKSNEYNNSIYDDWLGYFVIPCNQSGFQLIIDKIDSTCMKKEQADQFIDSENTTALITTYYYKYDITTNKLVLIPFDFYFHLSTALRTEYYLYITTTEIQISRGIIFPTVETKTFISGIDIKQSTVRRMTDHDKYVAVWLNLLRTSEKIKIEYIKLPDILAQFSSIYSILITMGIIFNFINKFQMKKELKRGIGQLYFKNYEDFYQQLSEIKDFSQVKQQFKSISKELDKQLLGKLSILNIIHEISKIQMALSTLLTPAQLIQIQNMKFKLPDIKDLECDIEQTQNEEGKKNKKELDFNSFKLFLPNNTIQKDRYFEDSNISKEFAIYKRVNQIIQANISNDRNNGSNKYESQFMKGVESSRNEVKIQSPLPENQMIRD